MRRSGVRLPLAPPFPGCIQWVIRMPSVTLDDGRKVTVRPLQRKDLESLHEMYLAANRECRQKYGRTPLYPWPMEIDALERYIAGMEKGDPRYHASVAVNRAGDVVGYTRAIHRADKDFTTYHTLVIRPDYRGSGLFEQLTMPVIAESAVQGKAEIRFTVNGAGAIKHYERKWGAEETSRKDSKHVGTIV